MLHDQMAIVSQHNYYYYVGGTWAIGKLTENLIDLIVLILEISFRDYW